MASRGSNTIEQRISLVGGDEIKKALQDIADQVTSTFKDFTDAAIDAAKEAQATPEVLGQIKDKMAEVTDAAGAFSGSLKELGTNLGDTVDRVIKLAGSLAGIVGFRAVFKFLSDGSAQAATAASKQADEVQIAVDKWSQLAFAFKQTGVETTTARSGLTRLNGEIEKTRVGGIGVDTILNKLNIRVTGFNGEIKDASTILSELADKFKDLPDGAEKSALAVQLFGQRAGPQFLTLLNQGSAGIAKFAATADRLGLTISKTEEKTAKDLSIAFGTMNEVIGNTIDRIGQSFAPLLTRAANAITEFIGRNQKLITDFFDKIAAGVTAVVDNVIVPSLQELNQIFGVLATAFNALFGTSLTAENIGLIVIGLQAVKVFTALLSVVKTVVTGFGLLSTTFGFVIPTLTGLISGFATFGSVLATVAAALTSAPVLFAAAAVAAGIAIGLLIRLGLQLLETWGPQIWKTISDAAVAAYGVVTETWAQISTFFTSLDIAALLKTAWDKIVEAVIEVARAIVDAFNNAITTVIDFFANLASRAVSLLQPVISAIQQVIDLAAQAARAIASIAGGGDGGSGGAGFAGGGHIRGAGGPKADKIPIWASNGEFMMQAAAVRKWGVGFLSSLNQGIMPRGFSAGGLINGLADSLAFPRFAEGGLIAAGAGANGSSSGGVSGRPLHLHMPDGRSFQVVAPEDTAVALLDYANEQRAKSAGKKPNWYGR